MALWCGGGGAAVGNGPTGVTAFAATEQETPICWVDGFTVYQKTISIGTLPNAATKSVAHGITGLGTVIYSRVGTGQRAGPVISIPLQRVARAAALAFNVDVTVDATNVNLSSASDISAHTGFVTLLYTRTASGCPGADVSFSLSEMGLPFTWVDGSPLFQKTISLGTLPKTAVKLVPHGISSISRIVQIWGTAQQGSPLLAVQLPRSAAAIPVGDQTDNIDMLATATDIVIGTNQDYESFAGYVTLQYVK